MRNGTGFTKKWCTPCHVCTCRVSRRTSQTGLAKLQWTWSSNIPGECFIWALQGWDVGLRCARPCSGETWPTVEEEGHEMSLQHGSTSRKWLYKGLLAFKGCGLNTSGCSLILMQSTLAPPPYLALWDVSTTQVWYLGHCFRGDFARAAFQFNSPLVAVQDYK